MATADLHVETLYYPHLAKNAPHEETAQRVRQSASALLDDAWRLMEQSHKYSDEQLRWFCTHPAAPEHLLLQLCDQGRFLSELGHRSGPESLLFKLADEHKYPEAILTLAKNMYLSDAVPTDQFVEFATRHRDSDWMMTSLAHLEPCSQAKEQAFLQLVTLSKDRVRLEEIYRVTAQEVEARTAIHAERIQTLYDSREYRVWRSLANNQHVSKDMLQKLAEAKDVKCAREIRDRAAQTLRRISLQN
ncbi:MAG: hypothetical protein K8T91_17080 [Planctomycetes bacterium]|nr:hypothetical protein [Planctomycetota bacterium]